LGAAPAANSVAGGAICLPACPSGGGEDRPGSKPAANANSHRDIRNENPTINCRRYSFLVALYRRHFTGPIGNNRSRTPRKLLANATSQDFLPSRKTNISKVENQEKERRSHRSLQDRLAEIGRLRRPRRFVGDADTISAVLYALSPLETDRVIEEKAGDLKTYGLREPAVEVSATGQGR